MEHVVEQPRLVYTKIGTVNFVSFASATTPGLAAVPTDVVELELETVGESDWMGATSLSRCSGKFSLERKP